MKLQFVQIEVSNFKSFEGRHTFAFDQGPGLHFIRGKNLVEKSLGPNGVGKTTMWHDAICWCLYGRTIRGMRGPDIRSWSSEKTTSVRLTVQLDDRQTVVRRTAAPNSLTIDDRHVGQDEVVALVGLSYHVAVNTILLGQVGDLFLDLTPSGKMQLFTDAFDLDRWLRRSDLAGKRATALAQKRSRLEGKLAGLEATLDEIKALFQTTRQQSDDWDQNRKSRLVEQRKELKALVKEVEQLTLVRNRADLDHDGAATEAKAIDKKLEQVRDDVNKLERERDRIRSGNELVEAEMERLSIQLKKLERTNRCPSCGQIIRRQDLGRHRDEIKTRYEEVGAELTQFGKGKKLKALRQQVKTLERQSKEFHDKADQALSALHTYMPRVSELEAKRRSVEDGIDALEQEQNPHREQMGKLRRRRSRLDTECDELDQRLTKLDQRIEEMEFWAKGFKEIRLAIVEETMAELEVVANNILEQIGLVGWSMSFATERETKKGSSVKGLNVSVLSPRNKKPVRWECWSGGEGQRLRLVGTFALSEVLLDQVGVQVGQEVLDEPTQHLSAEGVRDLCDVLADRAQILSRQIFYIDHHTVESARFDSVTTVIKDKKGSRLA